MLKTGHARRPASPAPRANNARAAGVKEIWKSIFGGYYAVSSRGRIARLRRKDGRPRPARLLASFGTPYKRVSICVKGTHQTRTVHSLIAEAFLGPTPLGHQIDHIDGDKLNNRLSNLEYVTPAQNSLRAVALGLSPVGERHYRAKLTEANVHSIRQIYRRGRGPELALKFGVHISMIHYVVHRKNWKHL